MPPSTFHEIINGPSVQKKETEGSTSDKDDKTAPSGGESENNKESDAEDKHEQAKKINPVFGGIWNQDLIFVGSTTENVDDQKEPNKEDSSPSLPEKAKRKGCKVMKPRYVLIVLIRLNKVCSSLYIIKLRSQRYGEYPS